MSSYAIIIQDLEFQYPGREGVFFRDFNLGINAGERSGLLAEWCG